VRIGSRRITSQPLELPATSGHDYRRLRRSIHRESSGGDSSQRLCRRSIRANPPRDVEEQERDLARDDERTVGYKTHHEENEGDAFGGGGATVGFSYKLFIVPRGAKPNRTDELLLADKIGNASAVWSKPRILEIRYDQARIFRSKISGTAETLTTSSMWSNCGSFPLDHPSSATCTSRRSMMCLAWHPMIYVGHMTVPLARGAGESCRGHFSTGEGPAGSC